MNIKCLIKKLINRIVFGYKSSPELFVRWLRNNGIKVGEGTIFFDPINTVVDIQNPKLLKIGSNVRITSGCKILTHDFSSSVIAGAYGECIGSLGTVDIGDNVFIGVNSVILKNTRIGNNVIIGAGSVVSGNIEADSVYAGIPAKRIMTLNDCYLKRKSRCESDIINVLTKIDVYNENELWKYLREYSCFFADAPKELQNRVMDDTGYKENCEAFYRLNVPEKRIGEYFDEK